LTVTFGFGQLALSLWHLIWYSGFRKMQSVADRVAELRRTKKRSSQSIANWIARERRRGNNWLADSIAEQAGIVEPKLEVTTQPHYWWQDD
jgi:hypothetical protein